MPAPIDPEPILRALAAGRTATQAAAEVDCSVSVVYKHLRDPLFNARLHELRGLQVSGHAQAAHATVTDAIGVLSNVMRDEDAANRDKVQAAKTLVELSLRLRQEAEILPRLAALEAALHEHNITLPLPVPEDASDATPGTAGGDAGRAVPPDGPGVP